MIIILAEEMRYPIGSFIDRAKKTFPVTSIINCTRDNYEAVVKRVSKPPSLSRGWLIFANLGARNLSSALVSDLEREHNSVIFIVRNRDSLREFSITLEELGFSYETVDNLSPSKELIVNYVLSQLNITEKDATYLVNRHNSYLQKISESVEILRPLPKVTRADIKKYTQRSADISFDDLFKYIIGQEQISHGSAVSLVKRYRYGIKFLVKFITGRFEFYEKVYDYVLSGQLSLINYIEFVNERKQEFKSVSQYNVKTAVEAVGIVSHEKLIQLKAMYDKELEGEPSVLGVLGLLELSKLGR